MIKPRSSILLKEAGMKLLKPIFPGFSYPVILQQE
jgi:hypothetical protein